MEPPRNDPSPACLAYWSPNAEAGAEASSSIGVFQELLPWDDLGRTGGSERVGWPDHCGLIFAGSAHEGSRDSVVDSAGGSGAAELAHDPELPVVSAGALEDVEAQEQFLDRVLGFRDVRLLFREGWGISDLVAFNVRERFRIIGHDPKKHRLIGRLVAKAKDHPRDFLEAEVASLFLSALARPMTRRKHRSVLEHAADFVRPRIDTSRAKELEEAIGAYARGDAPRRVPLCLLRRHVEETGIAGLRAQSYLYPDPIFFRFLERS